MPNFSVKYLDLTIEGTCWGATQGRFEGGLQMEPDEPEDFEIEAIKDENGYDIYKLLSEYEIIDEFLDKITPKVEKLLRSSCEEAAQAEAEYRYEMEKESLSDETDPFWLDHN